MNIVRCWSRSVGYFFNPRLLFKELSDYFSVAYRSMLIYIVIATALSFEHGALMAVAGLVKTLKGLVGYFFVVFGKKIKSLEDAFTYAHKNLATLFYLFVVMLLMEYGPRLNYTTNNPYEPIVMALGLFATLTYVTFAIYAFFVLDGTGYYKSIGRAFSFVICNLPFLVVLSVLNLWYLFVWLTGGVELLKSNPNPVSMMLFMGSLYAGSYLLLSINYLYYQRMKKYVR